MALERSWSSATRFWSWVPKLATALKNLLIAYSLIGVKPFLVILLPGVSILLLGHSLTPMHQTTDCCWFQFSKFEHWSGTRRSWTRKLWAVPVWTSISGSDIVTNISLVVDSILPLWDSLVFKGSWNQHTKCVESVELVVTHATLLPTSNVLPRRCLLPRLTKQLLSVHWYMANSMSCASLSICLVVAWAGQSSTLLLLHHYILTKQLRYMY